MSAKPAQIRAGAAWVIVAAVWMLAVAEKIDATERRRRDEQFAIAERKARVFDVFATGLTAIRTAATTPVDDETVRQWDNLPDVKPLSEEKVSAIARERGAGGRFVKKEPEAS